MRSKIIELVLPVLLALVHGFAYLFVVPPWQHYDEPGHMEYAWHIAHKQQLPLPGDVDREMRFDFVESMVRHGFYGPPGQGPTIDRINGETPSIGFEQLEDSPLYYLGPALAIWFVRDRPIEIQLYAARASSMLLLLLCVVCASGIARELAPSGHALRWMLPAFLAMLPPFVDLMTAVNSDAGAIAAYSLFLWGATRLVQRNTEQRASVETILTALWVIGSAFLCLFVKSSAASALVLMLPALILGLIPSARRYLGILFIFVLAACAAFFAFRSGDAAAWYRTEASAIEPLTQCGPPACPVVPSGRSAIRVASLPDTAGRLIQAFPPGHTSQLRGKTVTIAGWAWTTGSERTVSLPLLSANYLRYSPPDFRLTQVPAFFAYTRTVPADTHYLRLVLSAPQSMDAFYDGLIVIDGEPRTDQLPAFINNSDSSVTWAGTIYANMVRNGSAEATTLGLRPTAQLALDIVTPSWMIWPLGISSLLDLRGSSWYYALVIRNMFESFWGRFAWGQVVVPQPFFVMAVALTSVSVAAGIYVVVKERWVLRHDMLLLFVLSTIMTIMPSLIRGISTGLEHSLWLPGARYIYPVVIPLASVICIGAGILTSRMSLQKRVIAFGITGLIYMAGSILTVGMHFGRLVII